jgi:hypothetical protein
MYEWQCESEWGWGIYVFSPWQTFTVPSFCAAFALWRACGSFRVISPRYLPKEGVNLCTEFAQIPARHSVCTSFAQARRLAQNLHIFFCRKLPKKAQIVLTALAFVCYSMGNE